MNILPKTQFHSVQQDVSLTQLLINILFWASTLPGFVTISKISIDYYDNVYTAHIYYEGE